MAAFLLQAGAQLQCPHTGPVQVLPGSPRVLLGGQPVATLADSFLVSGCPVPPSSTTQPCVRVQWTTPALRIRSGGQPVLLQSSAGQCLTAAQVPAGPPVVLATQTRVSGT